MTDALDILAGHGPGVGAGHLGRCLALAEAWTASGGSARLVDDGRIPAPWVERYRTAGADVVGAEAARAPWVVVDDYTASAGAVAALRSTSRVLLVDDHGTTGPRRVDRLLDQNLGAVADDYPVAPAPPGLLLGPTYALVRREVLAARPEVPPDRRQEPTRLLVAVGGDPQAAVRQAAAAAAEVVAGRHGLELVWLEGVREVGRCLAGVDLAISAAGSTCWDLCLHGVPSVVVAVAPNQERIARALGRAEAAIDAGDLGPDTVDRLVAGIDALVADADRRVQLAATGRALVDGQGAARVVAALRTA